MRIIFISGDGHGAGKTHLARKMASGGHQIFSIANLIRKELHAKYPNYDWYNKSPYFKENTIVVETGKSIHYMLDHTGRDKKSINKIYWARSMVDLLEYNKNHNNLDIAIIDDVRFLDELEFIRSKFPKEKLTHFHVRNPDAKPEPMYENDKLAIMADYLMFAQRMHKF